MAAGITIAAEQIPAFARRFNDVAASKLTQDDLVPELRVDLEIGFDQINDELEALLRHVEPCGVDNPSPVFVTRGVTVAAPPKVVGRDGLKLRLQDGGREIVALGWGMGPRAKELDVGVTIDVAFRLERDEWNGQSQLQMRLADFRTQ
jgi:single-stranded-DNA-specific exonuclease